jgi:hypothetical protein
MGTISKKENKDGSTSYHVTIRLKECDICKTFHNEEAANLYILYKEDLINKMVNFEIPIKERIRLCDIFEMKILEEKITDKKTINDYKTSLNRINSIIGENTFLSNTTFDLWLDCAKQLFAEPVYRGAKTENGKRDMSPITLRRIFAYASSAFSFIQKKNIQFENYPLKVIQTFINPKIKK